MLWGALAWPRRSSGSNMDYDRIYDSLERANATLAKQGETLATISQAQCDMKERLFGGGGQLGSVPFLHGEIKEVQTVLADHTSKFTFYRGVAAVVTFMWTAGAGVVLALIGHHHK